MGPRTGRDRPTTGIDVLLTGGKSDPILQTILGLGSGRIGIDQEEPRSGPRREGSTTIFFQGPTEEGDIHAPNRKDRLFPDCFVTVNDRWPNLRA